MTPRSGSADPVPGAPNEQIPLLVVHIPRTGGSTLKFMLRTSFGLERTLLDAHWYRTDVDLDEFAVVEGHLAAGFFARTFGADWHANGLTMLREPVARTVSQARHIRARPGPRQEQLRAAVTDPDDVFARIPRLANHQTKQLSSAPFDATDVGEDALTEAKSTLDRLAFGLTESFDSSVALIIERFGFKIPKFDVANVSRGTHDEDLLSAGFEAAARRHNDLDRQLYEYAHALLRDRTTTYVETLLGLPADTGALTCALRYRRNAIDESICVPAGEVFGRIGGWVLVDGHAPDAVLVRVGDEVIPVVPGVERDDAARQTRDLGNRHAGILGTVTIPGDATFVELIAFDRKRGRRAERTIDVTRAEPKPLITRSAASVRARLRRLRP